MNTYKIEYWWVKNILKLVKYGDEISVVKWYICNLPQKSLGGARREGMYECVVLGLYGFYLLKLIGKYMRVHYTMLSTCIYISNFSL